MVPVTKNEYEFESSGDDDGVLMATCQDAMAQIALNDAGAAWLQASQAGVTTTTRSRYRSLGPSTRTQRGRGCWRMTRAFATRNRPRRSCLDVAFEFRKSAPGHHEESEKQNGASAVVLKSRIRHLHAPVYPLKDKGVYRF